MRTLRTRILGDLGLALLVLTVGHHSTVPAAADEANIQGGNDNGGNLQGGNTNQGQPNPGGGGNTNSPGTNSQGNYSPVNTQY